MPGASGAGLLVWLCALAASAALARSPVHPVDGLLVQGDRQEPPANYTGSTALARVGGGEGAASFICLSCAA